MYHSIGNVELHRESGNEVGIDLKSSDRKCENVTFYMGWRLKISV